MITIAVANRKGGVAKTTTSCVLAQGFAMRGHRVLAVDLDSQRSLSLLMKIAVTKPTVYEVLTGERGIRAAVRHVADNLDLIPGNYRSIFAETTVDSPRRLKESLSYVADSYDYCIVDCPPGAGIMTANALTAADWVVVPSMPHASSMLAIEPMIQSVRAMQKKGNPKLKVAGILITFWDARPLVNRKVAELMEQQAARLGVKLFDARIRRGIAVENAQARFAPLLTYESKSNPAKDYNAFLDEMENRIHAAEE